MSHHRLAYPVLFFAGFALVVLFGVLTYVPEYSGEIVAEGGTIHAVNIEGSARADYWTGLYGNVSVGGNASFAVVSGDVLLVDLFYDQAYTPQTVIVASLANLSSWESLVPASHADINAFLGLGALDSQSSQNTLTELVNFTIDDQVFELWSATTSSLVGTYQTGALLIDGNLSFVTKPSAGQGFDGSLVEYQLLLPVPGAANYSFFIFEQSTLPGGELWCNVSGDLTAVLGSDNASVVLSWSAVPGASSYEVAYRDGPSLGQLDFSDSVNVSVAGLSWTDVVPAAERYYKLRVLDASQSCLLNTTLGTLLLNLSPDYNLISTPFLNDNHSIAETFRSIDGEFSEVLVLNNTDKNYNFYLIVGQSVLDDFDVVEPGRGYWVRTSGNISLRLAGVLVENLSVDLVPDYNLVGFPVIDNSAANETIPYVLSSIDGNYSEVLVLDNNQKNYNFYLIVGTSVFKDFDTVHPGKGYWIRTGQNVTLGYANG